MANLEADVPQQRREALNIRLVASVVGTFQQDHQVDVGMRQQLAAAVAADGDQGDAGLPPAAAVFLPFEAVPGESEYPVHKGGVVRDQLFDRRTLGEGRN